MSLRSLARRSTRVASLALPSLVALLGCGRAHRATPAPPDRARATLVLFITVDQLRPEYLERFRGELDGGLGRLLAGGAYFTNGHHDHAITETAPGHATTMSGRFPRGTGITRNLAGVNDPKYTLLGARDLGAAPFRFRGTTLTDWLKAATPATRALSVSAKDRAAILPIGRAKESVYWYANNGLFTTSVYYADTLPAWLRAFNDRRLPQRFAGRAWEPLLPPGAYPEPDSVPAENGGRDLVFPHRFPTDSAATAERVRFTPFIDELTAQVALEGVRRMGLGSGPQTDVLAVSFSATDYVGHFFGPESREQHDQVRRLDRVLGAFLDTLFTMRDPARVVIALTADHGGGLIPELHGGRRVEIAPAMRAARAIITQGGGQPQAADFESGAFFLDAARLGSADPARVYQAFREAALAIPGVARVERFADLAQRDTTRDAFARRWLHMFPDDMLPVGVVALRAGDIYDYPVIATHGSAYDYDSNVPMLFYGAPFRPGRHGDFVRTVDIAPTLARVLGVRPLEALDGRPLTAALR